MKKIVVLIVIILILGIVFCIKYDVRDMILRKIYVIQYKEIVEKYSEEYDIDKYLIYAIIKAESNFNEKAVSSKGAKGLMQIMDSTASDIAKKINVKNDYDILEPDTNINFGVSYISMLIKKYEALELALCAYNAGAGNVDTWISNGTIKQDGSNIENVPFKETNNYVRKILNNYKMYKELYTN